MEFLDLKGQWQHESGNSFSRNCVMVQIRSVRHEVMNEPFCSVRKLNNGHEKDVRGTMAIVGIQL